jgi:hypothetical protein
MENHDDELGEILAERALGQFTRSGLGYKFVPDEATPASLQAFEDLKAIVLDAFRLGQQRAAGYATDIDDDLTEASESAPA